ncbi:MAG: two-component regulator propeller domain-containing protein [Ignavibacteriaceae bacterium]
MLAPKTKNNYLKLFFLLVTFMSVIGQQKYNFEHLSIPSGLSNSTVWDILQDKYGFLWVATADGLNRYDGYTFKIYKNDPGNSKSLANNLIYSLLIDDDETLWAGTNGGLCKYDRANETFVTYLTDSSSSNAVSNIIINILEDSKKRIWVATALGIFKFDRTTGKFEKTFIKDGNNKIPFTGTTVALIETSSGEIYSDYYFQGLIKFNESINLFEWINVAPQNPNIFNKTIFFNLYEDKTGKIWISGQNGFYNYDPHSGIFNELNLYKNVSNSNNRWINAAMGVFQDNKGYLWIGSSVNGIFRYNMKTNEVTSLSPSELPNSVHNSDGFWKFYQDEFGILWIATSNNGLLKLDFQKEPFRLFANPVDKVTSNSSLYIGSLYKSPTESDFIWLGTDDGLVKYNLNQKTFIKFNHQEGSTRSIPSNLVRSIQHGSMQELWLGTNKGLSMMNPANNSFTNYELSDKTKHYVVDYDNIYGQSMDDYGNLWIAAGNSGLVKFDTKNQTKQYIPTFATRTYDLRLLDFIDILNTKSIPIVKIIGVEDYQDLKKEFKLEKQTEVMIVSAGEGQNNLMFDYGWLLDSKADTVWGQTNYQNSFYLGGATKNRITIRIVKLNKGNYTLRYRSDDSHSYGRWNAPAPIDSTLWGVQVFDLSNSDVNYCKSLITASQNKPYINALSVSTVEYQNDGTVLLGTSTGLDKYDIRKNAISYLQNDIKNTFTSNLKQINDFFVDKNNVIWIGTNGGLIKYDQISKQFNILYDKDGLPSNYVVAIEEDAYGNLWLSTLNGISKFNKDIKHPIFINYDVKDGLQGYTFNTGAAFKSESGELFFAGQNGFNAFHSSNINKQVPKIDITQLKISNELVFPSSKNSPLTKSILETKEIEIAYSQNNISFEFSAIHFSRPEKNQYAYRLDGFDKGGWIYDNRKFATYTNLPPGDYVFRVKGSNGDGVWNEAGTSIKIRVLSPWWRTIWAYIGYVFIFGGMIFGVDRIQRRRLILKERERQRFHNAELRAQKAELQAKASEAERRALEIENDRKSKELESARELQLSMLPKQLPQFPHLDIAVYMKTATEVGGDYYDFNVGIDGTLTIVLGDATGHGMRAGTMVTSAKSLFNSYAANPDILFTFQEMTRCIKQMQFQSLAMCMTMLKIQNNRLLMSAAGMPPVYLYRNESRRIEEYLMKGMPLGTMDNFPYELKELQLLKGDTLLLMSDGFPELQNDHDEIFGYKRARNSFEEVAERDPEEIITYLKDEGSRWVNAKDPEDDVTFVVIKVKG